MTVLRRAVAARFRGLSAIAKNLNVASQTLDDFAHRNGALPLDRLQALTKEIFSERASYDPIADKLSMAEPPTFSLGCKSEPFAPPDIKFTAGPPPRAASSLVTSSQQPTRLPGWAE